MQRVGRTGGQVGFLADRRRQPQRNGRVELRIVGQRQTAHAHGIKVAENLARDLVELQAQPFLPCPHVRLRPTRVRKERLVAVVVVQRRVVKQRGEGLFERLGPGARHDRPGDGLFRSRQKLAGVIKFPQPGDGVGVLDLLQHVDQDIQELVIRGLQCNRQRPDRAAAHMGQDRNDPFLELRLGVGVGEFLDHLRQCELAALDQPLARNGISPGAFGEPGDRCGDFGGIFAHLLVAGVDRFPQPVHEGLQLRHSLGAVQQQFHVIGRRGELVDLLGRRAGIEQSLGEALGQFGPGDLHIVDEIVPQVGGAFAGRRGRFLSPNRR